MKVSKPPKVSKPLVPHFDRAGEGPLVDVTTESVILADGTAATNLGINISQAAVPDRRYVAEMCGIESNSNYVKLLFGQFMIGGQELRSLVVIHMSTSHAGRFLAAIDGIKDPSLGDLKTSRGIEPIPVESIEKEPAQTLAFTATVGMVAISDREACIDFFRISPFTFAAVAARKKAALDPVVRIDLATANLMGLVSALRDVENKAEVGIGQST